MCCRLAPALPRLKSACPPPSRVRGNACACVPLCGIRRPALLPEVYPAFMRGHLQAYIAAPPLPLATVGRSLQSLLHSQATPLCSERLRPRKVSGIYDRLGLDFDRYLCHNTGHHHLAAGPSPAHNKSVESDFGLAAPLRFAANPKRLTLKIMRANRTVLTVYTYRGTIGL